MAQRLLTYIPNALTLFRLILIGPFLLCFYDQNYVNAFYLFLLAGFTDGLDGWMARCFNWQSPFGSFIDPLADKLLVASSFISLALINQLPWWLVVLVFMRDLTISTGVIAWYYFVQRKLNLKRPAVIHDCQVLHAKPVSSDVIYSNGLSASEEMSQLAAVITKLNESSASEVVLQ